MRERARRSRRAWLLPLVLSMLGVLVGVLVTPLSAAGQLVTPKTVCSRLFAPRASSYDR